MRLARLSPGPALVMLLASLVLGAPAFAQPQDIWVDDDCPTPPGTGTSGDPYCSIKTAVCNLNVAGTGGTVHVRPGTYNESIRMFPNISLISTDGPAVTTIDGTGQPCLLADCNPDPFTTQCAVVVYGTGSTPSDRLEGFRITNGRGLPRFFGTGKTLVAGGGVFVFESSPTITRNEIVGNTVDGGTTIRDLAGGGIYVHAEYYPAMPVITQNLIEGNVADPPNGANPYSTTTAYGGGIYLGYLGAATIQDNTIRSNRTGVSRSVKPFQHSTGGGIAVYSAVEPAIISRNLIQNNVSYDYGGGIVFGEADINQDLDT